MKDFRDTLGPDPLEAELKMVRLKRVIPLIVLIAGIGCLAACQGDDPGAETKDRLLLEKMEADIDSLIGDAACVDAEDCRAIAFGDKPCGGPWIYKVYSVTSVDTLELAGMIDAYYEFNRTLNERYGWMSDCMFVMPPNIDCVEGKAVAVP